MQGCIHAGKTNNTRSSSKSSLSSLLFLLYITVIFDDDDGQDCRVWYPDDIALVKTGKIALEAIAAE